MAEKVGAIAYDVTLDLSKMSQAEREVARKLGKIGDEGDKLKTRFNAVAAGVTAALSAIAIEGLVSKIVSAQRQFDVLFSSLKTVTGGVDQASAAWSKLTQFAEKTPYTLDQTVSGFVKLKALGLDPSERAMTSFGNTASAMGKDLTQMIEAVADASTGEFERLKEFGIKAKTQGDQVSFTFQGVTTTVKNSAAEITEYLTKIGEVNFAGAMESRMATLDGAMTSLQKSWAKLYLEISASGIDKVMASLVRGMGTAVQDLTQSIKDGELVGVFSNFKGVLVAAEVAAVSLAGALTSRLIAAMVATIAQAYSAATAIGAASAASTAFSTVISALGGPIGILITGLGLLALNWDKVGTNARTAAEISEDAAARIDRALKKTTSAGRADLERLIAEADKGIRGVDERLAKNASGNKFGRGRGNSALGPRLSDEEVQALKDRKVAFEMQRSSAKEALDKLNPFGGRGFVNPEPVKPSQGGPSAPPKSETPKDAGRNGGKQDNSASIQADANRFNSEQSQAIGYAAGIINEQASPDEQIRARFDARKTALDEMLAQELLTEQLHAQAVVANEASMNGALKKLDDERKQAKLAADSAIMQGGSQLFGSMADMAKTFAGEQSATYKAMFAVSKAFAIADSIIKIQQAMASAAMSSPFPLNLGAMATVAASTASIISTISGTNFSGGRQYGGAVTAGSLYRVNETGQSEMFVGANGSQYMIPGRNGRVVAADDIGSGAAGGGDSIVQYNSFNISVSVDGGGSMSTQSSGSGANAQAAKQLAQMISAGAKDTLAREMRPGGLLWKMKQGQA